MLRPKLERQRLLLTLVMVSTPPTENNQPWAAQLLPGDLEEDPCCQPRHRHRNRR